MMMILQGVAVDYMWNRVSQWSTGDSLNETEEE